MINNICSKIHDVFGPPQSLVHGTLLFNVDLVDPFLDEINTHELQRIVKKK